MNLGFMIPDKRISGSWNPFLSHGKCSSTFFFLQVITNSVFISMKKLMEGTNLFWKWWNPEMKFKWAWNCKYRIKGINCRIFSLYISRVYSFYRQSGIVNLPILQKHQFSISIYESSRTFMNCEYQTLQHQRLICWIKSIWLLLSFFSYYLHRIANYHQFQCYSTAYSVPISPYFLKRQSPPQGHLSFFQVAQFHHQWFNSQKVVS